MIELEPPTTLEERAVYETRAVWLGEHVGRVHLQIRGHGRVWVPKEKMQFIFDARGNGGVAQIDLGYARRRRWVEEQQRGLEGLPLGKVIS